MKRNSLGVLFLILVLAPWIVQGQLVNQQLLFPVIQNGKWGYIDQTGKIVIPPQFDKASIFSDGYASIAVGGKWGCIDEKGNIVIEPRFSDPVTFSEGLARVVINDKAGYIDKTGSVVIEPRFGHQGTQNFSEGLALVEIIDASGWYLMDKTGKDVWKPQN